MTVPSRPKVYHITHVDNLPGIVASGGLLSDARMIAIGGPSCTIGMSTIKQRRLARPVPPHPGTRVGDYVPFYFCPRSVMLYLISCANHSELTYRGGQDPILHLEFDLFDVVSWATASSRPWAFTLSNAGASYAQFRVDLARLSDMNWEFIQSRNWRDDPVKEAKQAELLIHGAVPWHLVERVGARSVGIASRAAAAIAAAPHKPPASRNKRHRSATRHQRRTGRRCCAPTTRAPRARSSPPGPHRVPGSCSVPLGHLDPLVTDGIAGTPNVLSARPSPRRELASGPW